MPLVDPDLRRQDLGLRLGGRLPAELRRQELRPGNGCGGPPGGTATLACQNPCPPGLGCIPFTVDGAGQHYPGIRYPLEGCFGLPPG